MKAAPHPTDETRRIAELRSYGVLDTPAEREFDDFTAIASLICGTPISLISLIDSDRQWFKSRVGLELRETSRDVAFCAHAILGDEVMEVADATADPRFADNPLVTAPGGIRFYAGAPLLTRSGSRLGTLCVIDRQPRELSAAQREALAILGRRVVAQLELRRLSRQREADDARAWQRHLAALDAASEGIALIDGEGRFSYANAAFAGLFGHARGVDLIGLHWRSLHGEEELLRIDREVSPVLRAEGRWSGRVRSRRNDGSEFTEELTLARTPEPGFIRLSRDATAAARTEAEIASLRERLREVAEITARLGARPEDPALIAVLAERVARCRGVLREPETPAASPAG